ncbi:helix-hairpin-helix domain-containing protein [candidate division WOR-3 bacterium]|nr:helix-hairpin-helix domain-containing protein [candidate division WOR-3 bacterium]
MVVILFLVVSSQLDLNRAALSDIYTLPIDSTIAHAIYEYREMHGDFESVYDLRNVPGIDSRLFETIKPLVKIANPFPERTEWGSILAEQKKLAAEEPPSKAAIDEWEDLLLYPMYINDMTFDDLLIIDRMTPIDAAAVIKRMEYSEIKSSRDLRRSRGMTYYAYSSLRRYVTFVQEPIPKKISGSVRVRLDTDNRYDTGEDDENYATRISYLESALDAFNETSMDLINASSWTQSETEDLRAHLNGELDSLRLTRPAPGLFARLKTHYQKRLRIGFVATSRHEIYKGYVGLGDLGPIHRFYLGNYRVVWGEGLMIDNSDEYRARIVDRSKGIFGDLTDNYAYDLFGAAGKFRVHVLGAAIKPSFFYSATPRDAVLNPDGTVWRFYPGPFRFEHFRDRVNETAYGLNFTMEPLMHSFPGAEIAFEMMQMEYDRRFDPSSHWIDLPLDKYDPTFYPEITCLAAGDTRRFYGAVFQVPINNTSLAGEIVRQDRDSTIAYAYIVKGRIQYDYFYINALYRHYDTGYDDPYMRGFSEYRRFEDTPLERPYALVDPEYASLYDDPTPKPEEGVYLETRYQITRSIILTRAYLDLFRNVAHSLVNQRAYFEFEFRPVWAVRLRFGQKFVRKHLPRAIESTVSQTYESSARVSFYLSDFDALRVEARFGHVGLTAEEGSDMQISGGFLACSYARNFLKNLSVEGGIAVWTTDGMSQWIFEDIGIDFLSGYGMKFYIVSTQRIGSLLLKLKFRQKFTTIPHTGLYNNEDIYYPDMPGAHVYDYMNNETSTKVHLQMDYIF